MQAEELICSKITKKYQAEWQKSKRRALINNIRKKMYENNEIGSEDDSVAFSDQIFKN